MVVVINGQPQSGKSSFVKLCQDIQGDAHIHEYSTVDYVKEVAKFCGWDGVKTPKDRRFLSQLKEILAEWHDLPFQKSIDEIRLIYDINKKYFRIPHQETIIFIHCREPKEIQRFKDAFGEHCVTLLIRRPAVETDNQSNSSDSDVMNYQYEYEIQNDGDLDALKQKAENFLQLMEERAQWLQ